MTNRAVLPPTRDPQLQMSTPPTLEMTRPQLEEKGLIVAGGTSKERGWAG